MIKLDWRKFEIINEKYTDAFQTLCLHLFCRFVHTDVIPADFNQAGLETEPVKYKGKWYGFQSKYFDNGMDYKQIKHSVEKALDLYPNLDVIKIYYNCNARLSLSKTKKGLDLYAESKSVKLEWLGRETFEVALNEEKNRDLCQLFFGMGRELEYFTDTISAEKRKFLSSSDYMELDTVCEEERICSAKDLTTRLLQSNSISVIKGLPGTGKSALLEKIFTIISGVSNNFAEQIKIITEQKGIPMLIKLKHCATISIEQLIREKKWEYKISCENYKIIYLLDGLDEVSAEVAEKVISYVQELATQKSTRKIIITIRKASHNNVFLRELVSGHEIYEIENLNEGRIIEFFNNRGDINKKEILKNLIQSNRHLLGEIKDILLLNLLYDTVESVNDTTNLYDLFALKEYYLDDKQRGKREELDLPEPKSRSVLEINKKIAYLMHNESSVIISQQDFANVIFDLFPKESYQSANKVVNYILDNYFENELNDKFYSYQHRRYQEYFYVLHLYELFKQGVVNMRKEEIFTNCEFFEEFFLPFLQKNIEKEKNVVHLVEMNLFKTYLGKNSMWGADIAWYQYSDDFCYAVASQSEKRFYQILEDASMAVKGNVIVDYESIVKVVEYLVGQSIGFYPDPLEELFRFALRSMVIYWKCGKKAVVEELLEDLEKGIQYIKKEHPKLLVKLDHALFEEKYAEYFILIVILENKLLTVLDKINQSEPRQIVTSRRSKYDESLDVFFDIGLNYYSDEFIGVMDSFTNDNIEHFCIFLTYVENVHYLQDMKVREKLIFRLRDITQETLGIVMIKMYLGMDISKQAEEVIEKEHDRLAKERWIDLFSNFKEHDKAAFLTLLMKKNCTVDKYKHDSRVMYQNLYCNYLKVLEGTISYSKMMSRFFIDQTTTYINEYENITYYVTGIWTAFIKNSGVEFVEIQRILEKLSEQSRNVIHFGLLFKMLKKEGVICTEKLLPRFMPNIMNCYRNIKSIDISENIEKYFSIAYLHSDFDSRISLEFIRKGLNYGVLRHGWRKDGIVDTYLLEALKIMWDKNYLEWSVLKEYTEKYFEMIMVINRITDERSRCVTLEEMINMLIENDFSMAQQMMQKIVAQRLQTNEMIFQYTERLINMGYEIEDILSQFDFFDFGSYSQQAETMKLELLLALYYSDWYVEEEKKKDIKDSIVNYLQGDWFSFEEKWKEKYYNLYLRFCEEETIEVSITYKKEESVDDPYQEKEDKFCRKLARCRTSMYLQKLYNELSNYNNHIVIKNGDNWNMIVDKIYEIDGNENMLLDYFMQCKFPNQTFYSANSSYLYMPLGYYIKRHGITEQLWDYLKNNSGYAGFINLIKAYDYIGDKEMCAKLFIRFFEFCELLVFDEIE